MSDTKHYTVLARKYRPATFEDLIGQDAMVQTLRNAFESGRIAQAYMLTGVRGVGKTTTARILARALNFETSDKDSRPTVDLPTLGEHCNAIMESRHVDILEMDAASHTGIDNIREIIESAKYKPVSARYKVYIIDEIHMLSKGAFNALLKTLEEPPEHVKFIFATTEIRKVPVTVLSRCQRFDLKRISIEQLTSHFENISKLENIGATTDALSLIARAAEGSVRDGLSILDQAMAMASASGKIEADTVRSMLGLADRMSLFDLLEKIFNGGAKDAIIELDNLYKNGADPVQLLSDLAEIVHLITRVKVIGIQSFDQVMSEAELNKLEEIAKKLGLPLLGRAWQMLLKGLEEVNTAPRPIAALEMIIIRMAYVSDLPPPDEIIKSLKNENSSQGHTQNPNGAGGHGNGPKMEVLMGGQSAQVATQNSPQAAPTNAPGIQFKDFEEVVAYIADRRDIKMKIDLETYARLVKFEHGKIELRMEEGAPKNLANDLGNKLTQWTEERWIVALSRDAGEKTIAERRNIRKAAELEEIKQHPFVKDFIKHFPEAEIKKIEEVKLEGLENPDDTDQSDKEED